MKAWQKRVIAEKKALDDKIKNLIEFLEDPDMMKEVDIDGRTLLRIQRKAMSKYSIILERRIKRFAR